MCSWNDLTGGDLCSQFLGNEVRNLLPYHGSDTG